MTTLAMTVGIAGAAETTVAGPIPPPSVGVTVVDEAGVPSSVLAAARTEAALIYRRLGVRVHWVSGAVHFDSHFTIKVIARALSAKEVDASALGVTPGAYGAGAKIAYVFYDRVRAFSGRYRVGTSAILGHVMAHELGHLLLPGRPHSSAGLMSSDWGARRAIDAAKRLLTFSERESMLIRNHVVLYAAPANRRPPNAGAAARTDACDWSRMS